jgi:hypothetical protein
MSASSSESRSGLVLELAEEYLDHRQNSMIIVVETIRLTTK